MKKYLFLILFWSCIIPGFFSAAQVSTEEEDLDFLMGEEVTCENVVEVFKEYNSIVQLLEDVFAQSINNMSNLVHRLDNEDVSNEELLKQKKELREVQSTINDSKYQISDKGQGILFVLESCLNQK